MLLLLLWFEYAAFAALVGSNPAGQQCGACISCKSFVSLQHALSLCVVCSLHRAALSCCGKHLLASQPTGLRRVVLLSVLLHRAGWQPAGSHGQQLLLAHRVALPHVGAKPWGPGPSVAVSYCSAQLPSW